MSVEEIENAVHQVLQAMGRSGPLVTDDEIGLRYAMIDPILRGLGVEHRAALGMPAERPSWAGWARWITSSTTAKAFRRC